MDSSHPAGVRVTTGSEASAITTYFAALGAAFDRASAQHQQTALFSVGGQRWLVRHAGRQWGTRYLRAITHLRLPASDPIEPDLTIDIWDQAETGQPLPRPVWDWGRRLPHSYHSEFSADRCAALVYTGLYVLVDRAARHAWVWHPDGMSLPQWDFAAPLRDLIELWFKPSALIRVHAGAVATDGGGCLIVGASGSGKSTTTIACLRAGLRYLGDDYVLIDPEQQRIYSLYNSGKLTPDTLTHFPEFAPHVSNHDSIAEFKAILYFDTLFPDQMVVSAPLKAIFIPTVTHQPETQIAPVSAMTALQALAPSTLFQASDPSAADFGKISRMVRGAGAHRLLAGTDFDHLTAQVKEHLRHG